MIGESIALLQRMRAGGLDPWAPNFMAPIAERVRRETGLPGPTSWYISSVADANALVRDDRIDLVMLGRPLLAEHHWRMRRPRRWASRTRLGDAAGALRALARARQVARAPQASRCASRSGTGGWL